MTRRGWDAFWFGFGSALWPLCWFVAGVLFALVLR